MQTTVRNFQNTQYWFFSFLLLILCLCINQTGHAQGAAISITSPNTPLTQDFNTLATTGTTNTRTATSSIPVFGNGWNFNERIPVGGTGTVNNQYSGADGTATTNDTYSYGSTGSTDRALGMFEGANLGSILGFKFTNNTGVTVTSITIGYTGEEWRTSAASDVLAFQYYPLSGDLNSDALPWVSVPALNFTTPVTGTPAALNGNLPTNRTVIGPITINVNIPDGTTYTLRWIDNTYPNSAGMGIDDFTITLNAPKQNQTITFNAFAPKTSSDTLFSTGASSTSTLALNYTSSNPAVATLSNDTVQIRGVGTTLITASQPGNGFYNAATSVSQTLTVTQGTDLLAGWDFQTTTNGGTKVSATPATPKIYVANTGSGNIYLNGTNGSSTWNTTSDNSTTELNGFTGTPYNAVTALSTWPGSGTIPASLVLVAGSGNPPSGNGKKIVFKFDMSTHKDLIVSYATQRTNTGFNAQTWEYSVNGMTWLPVQIINSSLPLDFTTLTLNTVTGLNFVTTAYLRLTFTGATVGAGNNRLDNIRLNATSGIAPTITTQPSNASICQGTAATSTFTVAASGDALPTYQWQYSATGVANNFVNVGTGVPAGFTYSNATTATLSVQTSAAAASGTYYYRAVATNTLGSATSNSATLTINATPVATFASSTYSACEGTAAPIIISGTTGAVVTYTIDGGTAQTITLTGANTTLNSVSSPANTYTYLITGVSLSGCNGTSGSTTTVTINPLPIVGAITGPANVATGNSITLQDATAGGTWTIDAPAIASITSSNSSPATATVKGNAIGTATLSYSITNGSNCTTTVTASINVYDANLTTYRTNADGNFSNAGIWEFFNGSTYVPASNPPGNSNNIQIRNNVILNTDYNGTGSATFAVVTNGTLTIPPNHYLSSAGAVNFNGNLVTVQSDATGTGAIGAVTNISAISGATNVTVERYIPKKRAWRLITSPVTSATINSAWQEGNLWDGTGTLPSTGRGTLITGYAQSTAANANNHGYDFWSSTANTTSSIRIYQPDATSGSWVSLPSIAGVKISDYAAYMLFVRGDRSVNLTTDTSATTLRANGTLNQADNISVTVDHTKAYTLIGNPYASPIDFEQMYNASANIAPQFLVWSSKTGTYGAYILVRRDAANTYSAVPSPFVGLGTTLASGQYIQSGEGFFVQPSNTTLNGTFRISEASKSPSQTTLPNPFKLSPGTERKLWVNLNLKNNDTSSTLADGVLVRYDATYDNGLNEDDAIKQANFNENLGVQSRDNSLLIMEARSDIQRADTLQLNLWNTTLRTYQLQIKGDNFASTMNLHAFLEDSYLQTKQEVSLSGSITTVDFTVNSDTASYNHNRFRIVFQNDAVLPVTLTQVKAALSGNGVSVTWTVTNETGINAYTVERSTDGGRTYNTVATQAAKNGGAAITTYNSLDAQPQIGDNLYRIRSEAGNGQVIYSLVVKVTVTAGKAVQITFYPNPVRKDGLVNMQFVGLKQGSYLMSIYSHNGQVVYQRKITVSQDNATQTETLHLGASLVQGSYEVSLTDKAGTNVFKDQIVIGK